jgi:DNA-binding MarR family transcriptional regulator
MGSRLFANITSLVCGYSVTRGIFSLQYIVLRYIIFLRGMTINEIEAPAVLKADYRHLAEFRHELRQFLHFSESAARGAGILPQQHQAMLVIHGFSPRAHLAVGELAAYLKIMHHSAVGLVTRMQAKGLVAKASDPADRRRVLVRLTARGVKTLQKLSAAHKSELARLGPALRQILIHLETLP